MGWSVLVHVLGGSAHEGIEMSTAWRRRRGSVPLLGVPISPPSRSRGVR